MFREGVLRCPYKDDCSFGISHTYAVLNNLPVPVILFNNEC